ncbi:aldo-keto reductase family 1 member A1-like isoform X2 [Maniola jurtina]|uniref:aldo-keto reductase family 1 member A1-like isoform X2 n=1 Tax=Maniola jurtina TaxID=191418 RepID=UPI001E688754|nr:aldo-keto reductase family 1 member A1-like isoform X2 [Maniola jurtina]
MSVPEYIELEGGDHLPRVGFGTWQAPPDVLEKAVEAALEAGYRHFDSARAYENEDALGRALNRWIGGDPAKRKKLFVVTKLPPSGNRPESVEEYFEASRRDLGLDYIDMYLIHVPFAFEHVPGDLHPKNPDGSMKMDHSTDLVGVWKKLLKLKESGRVRHVGVSNMNEEQLSRLCAVEKPACLQVEVHVLCQQKQLIAAANRLGIPIVAYSPLGSKELADALAAKTGRDYPNLLELPTVLKIAKAHSRTPAQVLLRYLLQHGVACIPKSTSPSRIKENISLWDFELTKNEMQELAALDRGENGRICDFAFFVGAEKHPEFPFKK